MFYEIAKVLAFFCGDQIAKKVNCTMSADEAAEFLAVSRNELIRYTKFGLVHFKRGRKYWFSMKDLIEFRDKFKVEKSR